MKLDERGKQCPLPVIDTKKALDAGKAGKIIEVLVDNEIAVQNLRKMADHKGLVSSYEKLGDREFLVKITSKEGGDKAVSGSAGVDAADNTEDNTAGYEDADLSDIRMEADACQPDSRRKGMVVVLSSNLMGQGDEKLGKILMKGYVYALTQQDRLPETVLLYNSGAYLSCEGSDNLEDLKELEAQGVEILTCGTCLNHYGLGEMLKVGSVTNMYEIVERMTAAKLLVRP